MDGGKDRPPGSDEILAIERRLIEAAADRADVAQVQAWAVQAALGLQKLATGAIKSLEAERSRVPGSR